METVELQIKQKSYGATPQDGTTLDVEIFRNQRGIPTIPGPTEHVQSRTSASADQTETVKEDLLEINTMNVDVRVARRDKLTLEEVLIEDVLRPIFLAEPLPPKKSRQHLISYFRCKEGNLLRP